MNVLLLRLVKAKAQNQGKAKARVLPMLILQTKAKRAKKAKKARRVKKVPTPKATRAKKDRRAHTPGPSWKVARVQPKGTQNDRFSPSFLPLPPVSVFHFLPPWLIRFTASCLFFPPFSCLLTCFLSNRTQSVIPAHSVLGFPPSLRYDPVGHSGPLGLWRVFLSLLPRCSLGSVGHSGPLSPLLPQFLFALFFSLLLHHRLDSVGHSGPLGLWQLPRSSLLPSSPFFI